eukprot:gnl/MRDRNA2_/MRDRNA2_86267_c0_seq3.p1 gnl/MRDRNA2_/MRDRNA2_86267_c0~~gnl/MRDRNA2_/MRDRNA2_86267_c0_seq3.p1  ORF type:complete len:155 (+),score=5.16 gnl/MRDRNA2_/MRDRNA2_86267_c0_seq3:287-751(+)
MMGMIIQCTGVFQYWVGFCHPMFNRHANYRKVYENCSRYTQFVERAGHVQHGSVAQQFVSLGAVSLRFGLFVVVNCCMQLPPAEPSKHCVVLGCAHYRGRCIRAHGANISHQHFPRVRCTGPDSYSVVVFAVTLQRLACTVLAYHPMLTQSMRR